MSKQHVIAVSESVKNFFNDIRANYSAPGKSKDDVAASEREIGNAAVAFIEANRASTKIETSDEGEEIIVDVDLFDLEMRRELALRATTSRASAAADKIAAQEQELAELRALLEKLQAPAAAPTKGKK